MRCSGAVCAARDAAVLRALLARYLIASPIFARCVSEKMCHANIALESIQPCHSRGPPTVQWCGARRPLCSFAVCRVQRVQLALLWCIVRHLRCGAASTNPRARGAVMPPAIQRAARGAALTARGAPIQHTPPAVQRPRPIGACSSYGSRAVQRCGRFRRIVCSSR